MQMYNPEYFSMRDLLKYPERASPDYFTYVQQILARKRHTQKMVTRLIFIPIFKFKEEKQ